MGTAAGFGQSMGGQTGVGSASTQTGQTGGKGGGFGTPTSAQNPYASSQPQQTQPQPYQPMGGNAFGYNMARLARQMDPSATLPTQQPQQTPSTQTQQPAQTGGKGGGQPGVFGIPQEFEPFAIDAIARSYGYQPYQPSFFQPAQGQEFQAQQPQPFDQGFNAQQERMAQLERQLADLTSRQQTQAQQQDRGEVRADLPEPFEEFGVGQTPAETVAEEQAAAAAPPPAPTGYQFGTYTNFNPQELTGFSKNQITQLYKQQLGIANADIKEAQRMQKAAKTPAEIKAANDALAAANTRRNTITADQKAALRLVGKTGYQAPASATPTPAPAATTPTPAPAATAPTPAPAATSTASPGTLQAARDVNAGVVPAPAPAPAAAAMNAVRPEITNTYLRAMMGLPPLPKKAKGGVIHTGMTSNLKKMLKNK